MKRKEKRKEQKRKEKQSKERKEINFYLLKPHYEAHPLVLTRSFGHPRIVMVLQPLMEKQIDSKAKLLAEWYPSYFLLSSSFFFLYFFTSLRTFGGMINEIIDVPALHTSISNLPHTYEDRKRTLEQHQDF